MNYTIHKYTLDFSAKLEIKLPKEAEILDIQLDQKTNKPCLWVLLDKDEKTETRYFELFVTGQEIHYGMGVDRKYLGTFQYQRGEFIGHVFERL